MNKKDLVKDYPNSENVQRDTVDAWDNAVIRVTGTDNQLDGDGITVPLENLFPEEEGIVEVIVDEKVVHRLVQKE